MVADDEWLLGMRNIGVVVLAGGDATRLPGKLGLTLAGETLLERACRTFAAYPLVVSCAVDGDALPLGVPVIADRYPRRGPLGGLVSTCQSLAEPFVFALAADMPLVTLATLETLADARLAGDEGVVPEHEGGIEPLAALYHCAAVLREGTRMLEEKALSMHEFVHRVNARRVRMDAAQFANINTPADWRVFSASRTHAP